jgi:peptidyl-prolyl cis-trans isomerase C
LIFLNTLPSLTAQNSVSNKRILLSVLVLAAVVGLSACGNKDKKVGQSLAVVNGEEITVHQLNDEMARAGVKPEQRDAATKQLLEALVDRQLLLGEAARDKTDRDPKVVQAIERAKSQIIAQAYMQKRVASVGKPTKSEVEDYFSKNPQFFTERKQFYMKQLVIATKNFNDTLKAAMDAAKSLEDVAAWMDVHNLKYGRGQLSRSSSDLPTEMSSKLLSMPRSQLFLIKEGERTLLLALADIKDSPVTLEVAGPQIENFLFNKKTKEAADEELKRLRVAAKIEYLNKTDAKTVAAASATVASTPAPEAKAAETKVPDNASAPSVTDVNIKRGISGLE